MLQSSISGKNYGYEIYKEIKGEKDFERKMKEADTVRILSSKLYKRCASNNMLNIQHIMKIKKAKTKTN